MLQTSAPKVEPVQTPMKCHQGYFDSEDRFWASEETYWAEYYHHSDFNYEWNNGYLEEKGGPDEDIVMIYRWFSFIVNSFLHFHDIAQTTTIERDVKTDEYIEGYPPPRKPDLAIVLDSNPAPFGETSNRYNGIFDLYVETISDTTPQAQEHDASIKKDKYEEAGTKEYYILDDSKGETAFYRLNQSGLYEEIKPIDEDIIQSEVLPGFQFRISDLYRMPSMHELVKDEVYQGYILVYYQEDNRQEALALAEQACTG